MSNKPSTHRHGRRNRQYSEHDIDNLINNIEGNSPQYDPWDGLAAEDAKPSLLYGMCVKR